ncbi:MAG: 50S ribosomal protein L2 [Candidatus Liptonbacteria bacterium]|nr:50S ribosomal protein L2 [Candidatus Liptonbacteria bacterium]
MKSYSPTSPSRRQQSNVEYRKLLTGDRPHKALLKRIKQSSGRNSAGRITQRHQGGGNKKMFRILDLKQNKMGSKATVLTVEYDPYRTAFIALVEYTDKTKAYILAPHGITKGAELMIGETTPLKTGNRMKLKNITVGYQIHNVELAPGQGGKIIRSAGSYAEVLANTDGYTDLKMPSGEVRRVPWECLATLGQVSNIEHNLVNIGKAGRSRHMGVRPTVRGSAMNPVDHPYGGGEGAQPRGTKRPKDVYGNITGGRKTRPKRKPSNRLIVKRRTKNKR